MFKCKRCGAMLFEDYIIYDEDTSEKFMQLGCVSCPVKLYIPLKKWNKFKKDVEANLKRIKDGRTDKVKEG